MYSSIASPVFTRRFSCRLLVSKRIDGFNEFLVSKNNLRFAESFIFKDKKGGKPVDHSGVFNYFA
jgi:hypothetical protein